MFEPNLQEVKLNSVIFSVLEILKFEARSYGVKLLRSGFNYRTDKIVLIDKLRVQ